MVRAINKYTMLREKSTGRVGQIQTFRLDLSPRDVSILVKFKGQANAVNYTGLNNILDTFEVVREVNGILHTQETDAWNVMCQSSDLEGSRHKEMIRTVTEGNEPGDQPCCHLPASKGGCR